MAYSIRVSIAS
ncbi:uncharacterized protein FFM5_14729 [Fusarium fujikuroi]|nr:uncharacterized protein FFM5_14729 [Fusarium fujikuroi]